MNITWSKSLHSTLIRCLVTEARRCEKLPQGFSQLLPVIEFEPTTCWSQVQRSTCCATAPPGFLTLHMFKVQYFVGPEFLLKIVCVCVGEFAACRVNVCRWREYSSTMSCSVVALPIMWLRCWPKSTRPSFTLASCCTCLAISTPAGCIVSRPPAIWSLSSRVGSEA